MTRVPEMPHSFRGRNSIWRRVVAPAPFRYSKVWQVPGQPNSCAVAQVRFWPVKESEPRPLTIGACGYKQRMTETLKNVSSLFLLGLLLDACAGKSIDFTRPNDAGATGTQNGTGGTSSNAGIGGTQSGTGGTTSNAGPTGGSSTTSTSSQTCPVPGDVNFCAQTAPTDNGADAASGSRDTWASCNPHASIGPVTLNKILSVGRTSDSTLYVVDEDPSTQLNNVYVFKNGTLQRQAVGGTGQGGDTDAAGNPYLVYELSASGPESPFLIRVEVNPDTKSPNKMRLLKGPTGQTMFDADHPGESLTLLPISQVAGIPAIDTRPAWVVVARATYGNGLVIAELGHNGPHGYDASRIFYGSPSCMLERLITGSSTTGAMYSPLSTTLFSVDGVHASLGMYQSSNNSCYFEVDSISCSPTQCAGLYQLDIPDTDLKYSCFAPPVGTTDNGGLAPITDNQLAQVQAGSNYKIEPMPNAAAATSTSCRFPFPQTQGCVDYQPFVNVPIDMMNVIYTKGAGSTFLVGYTNADCPSGDGYYLDPSNNTLVLCPATCAAIEQDDSASLQVYVTEYSAICIY
jgi:hypothetical protein